MDTMTVGREQAVQDVGEKMVAMVDRMRQAERWAPPEADLCGQVQFCLGGYRVCAVIDRAKPCIG